MIRCDAYPLPVIGNANGIITDGHVRRIETSPEVDTVICNIGVASGLERSDVVFLEIEPG